VEHQKRPFPVVGVLLVSAILAMGIFRELFDPEWGQARYVFATLRAVEVVLDMVFLTAAARWLDGRRLGPARVVLGLLAVNLVACVVFSVASNAVMSAFGVYNPRHVSSPGAVGDGVFASLYLYGLWTLAFRYPHLARSEHLRALEAERLRDQAELVQLRAHLQPHFLRNSLNAIAALITQDAREARRMLATLGDLLTDSLTAAGPTHTLDEEMSWLRRYAGILEARHHAALLFVWNVEPAARGATIPTLLLQPLVENAAVHGALCRDGDGEVAVRAKARGEGGVEVVIEDNGPGFDPKAVRPEALGLYLVRRRLEIECPGGALRIESSASGTRAIVEIP
jgi:signal transduction histidine kinase